MPRDETLPPGHALVVAGVIGARLTWDDRHTGTRSTRRSTSSRCGRAACSSRAASSPRCSSGCRRSGSGPAAALAPTSTATPYGLTIGLAIGRIGCTSVGEHFGVDRADWFPLTCGTTAATVREPLARQPADVGGHGVPQHRDLRADHHGCSRPLPPLAAQRTPAHRARHDHGRSSASIYGVARGFCSTSCGSTTRPVSASRARSGCACVIPTGSWGLSRVLIWTTAADLAAMRPARSPAEAESVGARFAGRGGRAATAR